MIKKITLILSLITTLHTHTMENNEPIQLEENTFNYLAILSPDIQNLIAQFLIFHDIESAEEFIERTETTTPKDIPTKYFLSPANDLPSRDIFYNNTLTGFCPNKNNFVLLDSNNLKIINTNKDQEIYQETFERKDFRYTHIALSRGAHMFATIHETRKRDRTPHYGERIRYIRTEHLTIKNITSKIVEELELPGNFKPAHRQTSLAFNKEGTHIILRGVDYTQSQALSAHDMEKNPHHIIIPVPVTINEPLPKPKTKTLKHYFQHKLICKNFGITNPSLDPQ